MKSISIVILFYFSSVSCFGQELAQERVIGKIEVVATFDGPMPTGVTVTNNGRIFVNFPRWGDHVEYTVAEVKDGKTRPYPNADLNHSSDTDNPADKLVSVQSVVVDPGGSRLWILDTGSVGFGPVKPGGPKLIAVDLATNRVIKKIIFPADVALTASYVNDVRFDLRRGAEGMAFITDSTSAGPNGIIVADLASGKSWRRLNDHPSTRRDPEFVPVVEGEILQLRLPGKPPMKFAVGSDGIAISPDGKTLYYCPLTSRHLYSVSVDALADRNKSDADVAATIKDLGEKGGASDGLESDAQGRVYLSDYEHNAIRRRTAGNEIETLMHDPRALWPDSLSLAADGYLYFTANQVERSPSFHNGQDLRQKPYVLFRMKVDGTRIQ
ncbi:MAG TPA: L-dopachrome tautomerase-related protein [Candidatus Acidoferrum sp.]|nr:L-dopachrome tautomerase-related protein [Candidatus Acidoferrum sp.]